MPLQLDYEVSDKTINWKITAFGVIFLSLRIIFMSVFIEPDGRFHPEIFHTSYLISILLSFSMVFSFRVKPLNAVAFATLPSVIFTLFLHDIPIWLDPSTTIWGPEHQIGGLLWWNFLTIHTPIPILAFYMYYTKKETMSLQSIFIIVPIGLAWFFTLDDKENGVVDGPTYLAIALPIILIWGLLYIKITKDFRTKDPLIAPVIEFKKIRWVKPETK